MLTTTLIIIGILLLSLLIILYFCTNYFYNFAIKRKEPTEINYEQEVDIEKKKALMKQKKEQEIEDQWIILQNPTDLFIQATDGISLHAQLIKHKKQTGKVMLMAHGYTGRPGEMVKYAKYMSDTFGYDILLPDARAHHQSGGKAMGMGVLDADDYILWLEELIKQYGNGLEIALFGQSMGAAAVMMMSSKKNLPQQVKFIVSDCGYTSVTDELTFQLKEMFNLPSFPLLPLTSLLTKIRAGYYFSDGSAYDAMKKNKLPIIFIHGENDHFVPVDMVYKNAEATTAEKMIITVPLAKHTEAWRIDTTGSIKLALRTYVDNYLTQK